MSRYTESNFVNDIILRMRMGEKESQEMGGDFPNDVRGSNIDFYSSLPTRDAIKNIYEMFPVYMLSIQRLSRSNSWRDIA